ncbi:NAD(P)-binding protein [Aspergillus ellipticus CBS 707.79]|uniref:NAD(P)-binding protein n=1 Tax=Aspergillus ellipticus CBS 707.79 TaxID=1448320 RepID=A0A319CUE6_9EURO|nr:NAD(P)-binding protein [Aspergillus ellipticus CBS 707.79]
MTMQKIAIVGASGSIGSAILRALIAQRFDVTAISRTYSTAQFPEGVKVVRGDYDDTDFLRDSLAAIDALVLCVGTLIPSTQIPFIDAAIQAGVKWIFPSEFGTDSGNPEYSAHVPIIPPKIAIQEYLKEKVVGTGGAFAWSAIVNGLILDWSIPRGVLGVNIAEKKATLLDGGEVKVNITTLALIGNAVAKLLALPEEQRKGFANRLVYISSFRVSQVDLLKSVQAVTGTTDSNWEIVHESTEDKLRRGKELFAKGEVEGVVYLIYGHVFQKHAGGDYEARVTLDNRAIGLSEEDLDTAIAEFKDL